MPNAQMAGKILDMINKYPENFDMSTWISYISEDMNRMTDLSHTDPLYRAQTLRIFELDDSEGLNICDTTLCVSGWAVALDGWEFNRYGTPKKDGEVFEGWIETGKKILDISQEDADILFGTTEIRAKIALGQLAQGAFSIDWDKVRDEDPEYDSTCDCCPCCGCNC